MRSTRSGRTVIRGFYGTGWLFVAAFSPPAFAQKGACCLSDATCVETNAAGCELGEGEFLGAGTSCVKAVCTGACCRGQAVCDEGSADDCASKPAGVFQGAGTECATHCPGLLGTGFTYQGQLKEDGAPATGTIDVEISLWTAAVGGDPVGGPVTHGPVQVVNGLFTIHPDFGLDVFDGDARWLEIALRSPHDPADSRPFATLMPRHLLAATPYALAVRGLRTLASDDPIRPDAWNVVGGHRENSVAEGVAGGTISGGGNSNQPNRALGSFSTIGGGKTNRAGDFTIVTTGATVAGGSANVARRSHATVGGGFGNDAEGAFSTVPGGRNNFAGGEHSFAAGLNARVRAAGAAGPTGDQGTFVWADSTSPTQFFTSTGRDQFLIRATGGVGIGTNDPEGFQLAVNGTAAKPGGGSWSTLSDKRLKRNVRPMSGTLDKLLKLNGYEFDYAAEAVGKKLALPGRQIGLIAQEVEKVFPEWVGQDKEGYKYVTERGTTALMVEALRELRAENAELRTRLTRMEKLIQDPALALDGGK